MKTTGSCDKLHLSNMRLLFSEFIILRLPEFPIYRHNLNEIRITQSAACNPKAALAAGSSFIGRSTIITRDVSKHTYATDTT
jgi:hypothetical protein